MTPELVFVPVIVVAVIAWLWTRASAAGRIALLRDHIDKLQHEIRALTREATRARERAAQAEHDAATWAAGWQQGRDDVFTVVPLFVAARDRLTDSGAPATDQSESQ